jgi:hypothetical protein
MLNACDLDDINSGTSDHDTLQATTRCVRCADRRLE